MIPVLLQLNLFVWHLFFFSKLDEKNRQRCRERERERETRSTQTKVSTCIHGEHPWWHHDQRTDKIWSKTTRDLLVFSRALRVLACYEDTCFSKEPQFIFMLLVISSTDKSNTIVRCNEETSSASLSVGFRLKTYKRISSWYKRLLLLPLSTFCILSVLLPTSSLVNMDDCTLGLIN